MQKDSAGRATAGLPYLPGSEGIWTFVLIDMAIFLLIFFSFMAERLRQFELYTASQLRLSESFGLANTIVLITSSWMVAEAVKAARERRLEKLSLCLTRALLCGFAFSVIKLVEYHSKLAAGITPITNSFFSFYFFITVIHFLHVIAGMIFLLHYRHTAQACTTSRSYITGIENIGVYWHYVDVLWVFIFPLLYLISPQ